MSYRIWALIHGALELLHPLREAETPAALEAVDLVELRAGLRARLENLRDGVRAEHYSERDAYFLLFPLVAHCDELVKTLILDLHRMRWPPLQQELYQLDDAGDVFYELLDSLLAKPETPSLIHEVYFFCLSDGFRGRYGDNPDKTADYLRKLREGIRVAPVPAALPAAPAPRPAPWRIPGYAWYGAAGCVLLLCYLLLRALASAWQPPI